MYIMLYVSLLHMRDNSSKLEVDLSGVTLALDSHQAVVNR